MNIDKAENQNKLMAALYKDTLRHEIKKKDHPQEVLAPQEFKTPKEVEKQVIDNEAEVQPRSDVNTTPTKPEQTTVGILETLEDIYNTVTDGIKLTNDLRGTVESFRGSTDEFKTVLDTNSEIISSKNIKTDLVNIAEEMTLENHVKVAEASYFSVIFLGIASGIVLIGLYLGLKRKAARMILI